MKHHEFWHPRLFEAPYYAYLLGRCALHGISPRGLAKANYALDHGELGIGSKYHTQMAFAQNRFMATMQVQLPNSIETCATLRNFVADNGFPLILKPDIGVVGKGVIKVSDAQALEAELQRLHGTYLLQGFCPHGYEYGVFFVRSGGSNRITDINRKHFPTVIGNGVDTIGSLARAHPRYTDHWPLFLKYLDTQRVPADQEQVRLSFIGSHTMGCRFTDDTHLLTEPLAEAIYAVCDSQPGFNFGRFDVKTADEEALQNGEFTIIEINGVASLPTHMFDPEKTVFQAWKIFLEHGRHLSRCAAEQRHRDMHLDSYPTLWRRAKRVTRSLDQMHAQALAEDR